MKKITIKSLLLAGFMTVFASFAQANVSTDSTVPCNPDGTPTNPTATNPTICVQFGGSSAAKGMGAEFALDFLDSTQTINHYVSALVFVTTNTMIYTLGKGDLNVWTGIGGSNAGTGVTGNPLVISYAATHSMDGYGRLTCQQTPVSGNSGISTMTGQYYYSDFCKDTANTSDLGTAAPGTVIPMSAQDSRLPQLDWSNSLGSFACTGYALKTYYNYANTAVTVNEYTGCTGAVNMSTTAAASDVTNSGYSNTGPSAASTKSLVNTGLSSISSFWIPFQFAVTNTLLYTNPKTGVQETPVLTRQQIQSLFNNPLNIPTWNLIPGFDGNSQSVFVCMRLAGSGTKAGVNSTVLKPVSEYIGSKYQGGANYAYNFTGGDMKTCLASPPTGYAAIGYINADNLPSAGITGIAMEGVLPNADPNYNDPKATIRDLVYPYITEEQLSYRTNGDPAISTAQQTFINTFFTASTQSQYLTQPTSGGVFTAGAFWTATGDMCDTRANTDVPPAKSVGATTANGTACPIK